MEQETRFERARAYHVKKQVDGGKNKKKHKRKVYNRKYH